MFESLKSNHLHSHKHKLLEAPSVCTSHPTLPLHFKALLRAVGMVRLLKGQIWRLYLRINSPWEVSSVLGFFQALCLRHLGWLRWFFSQDHCCKTRFFSHEVSKLMKTPSGSTKCILWHSSYRKNPSGKCKVHWKALTLRIQIESWDCEATYEGTRKFNSNIQ